MRIRIDRCLVGRGVGSRREIARWIRQGRVRVEGEVVRRQDRKVDRVAVILLDGRSVPAPPDWARWHKPVGVVTSVGDPWGRENLSTRVPALLRLGLHPVGRLDQDTSGLLLFSRDGRWTQGLLHPRRGVPRTYEATVDNLSDGLVERLLRGVETAEGVVRASQAERDGDIVRLTVHEGKHRMVRRMLANAGAPCRTLHRVAYGPVHLGALAVDGWEPLGGELAEALCAAAGSPSL